MCASVDSTDAPDVSSVPEALLALAPTQLPNYRRLRYQGDDLCTVLDDLDARDQTLIRSLYQALTELLFAIADPARDDAQKWQAISDWAERRGLDKVIDEAREIGLVSHDRDPSEGIAKTMHDVRGGALSALLGRLQLLGHLPHTEEQLNAVFILTRDHLKIMRNALVGLDEPRRNADRTPKAHALSLIVEKWHHSIVGPRWRSRSIRMSVDCRYEGALTECCLESAAIDRIFYNLAANACRYAADEQLEMVVFPVGDCLRFVLSNRVNAADAETLCALTRNGGADSTDRGTGESLFALFEPEVSSTGSGFGLTVVADFVASAFGLPGRARALRERYVGAILQGDTFRAWFHWPMAHDNLPRKLDDYHRPQESLSEP